MIASRLMMSQAMKNVLYYFINNILLVFVYDAVVNLYKYTPLDKLEASNVSL